MLISTLLKNNCDNHVGHSCAAIVITFVNTMHVYEMHVVFRHSTTTYTATVFESY